MRHPAAPVLPFGIGICSPARLPHRSPITTNDAQRGSTLKPKKQFVPTPSRGERHRIRTAFSGKTRAWDAKNPGGRLCSQHRPPTQRCRPCQRVASPGILSQPCNGTATTAYSQRSLSTLTSSFTYWRTWVGVPVCNSARNSEIHSRASVSLISVSSKARAKRFASAATPPYL